MKGEARLLLEKACDSLLLGIEKFNCPFERGRITSVLISFDHGCEMLLKSSILQRGGRIRNRGSSETLGFDACVRVGLDQTDAARGTPNRRTHSSGAPSLARLRMGNPPGLIDRGLGYWMNLIVIG